MSAPSRPSVLRLSLVVIAVALVFAGLESAQGRLLYRTIPAREFWGEALLRTLPSWLALAALVPGIVWLTKVARIRRESWRTALAIQLLGGIAFTLIHLGCSAGAAALRRHAPFSIYFEPMFARYAVTDLFTYAAIVAGLHAWYLQAEAREREAMASELRIGLAQAKLQFLRAQLHPHFLFNALNSISSLALNGERERVAQTVASLSELLRCSLDESADHEVPLATELERLDHYLDLERVRFGDRLAVEHRLPPDVRDALVPSLILQPLVENAVRHGIEARRGPGRIVIEAARDRSELRIEVRDSGPGFPADPGPAGRGIGLRNTAARLEQLYGTGASLERGSAPEGGARVTLRLPFRRAAAPAVTAGVS